MRITISGATGSGKSTAAKMLAKKLGYTYYSIGGLMRDMAKEKGLSLIELTKMAELDRQIDNELDLRQKEIGKKENVLMDSRLGFYFIPDSFKIFLDVDIKEAAKRIMGDRRQEESYKDINEAVSLLKKRMKSESLRYKKYYNIKFPAKKDFDLIIDTTSKTPDKVVDEIISNLRKGK